MVFVRGPVPLTKQNHYASLKDQYPSIQELIETNPSKNF